MNLTTLCVFCNNKENIFEWLSFSKKQNARNLAKEGTMSPELIIKKTWRLLDNLLTAPMAVISPFLLLLGMELVRKQGDVIDISLAPLPSMTFGAFLLVMLLVFLGGNPRIL